MNSPKDLIESQFPNYFLEQYPQFVKFIEEYYDFLEASIAIFDDKKNCKVGDLLYGSLSKAKAIVKIIADNKIYFEYETKDNNFYKNEIILNGTTGQTYLIKNLYKNIYSYARDIEENTAYDTVQNIFKKYFKRNVSLDHSIFSKLDPNTLTKKILDYYQNRGTENSYYWFFRIFFDDVVDLYYPKVDILRLSDTHHVEKRWMQIVYKPNIIQFEKTRIKGSKSKATATVRGVQVKTKDNQTRSFLDLIYINGAFQENEEIIGYDIITGDELVRGTVLSSIIGLNVVDGGVGHKVNDEFSFNDGIGKVSHLEKNSVTDFDIKNVGVFYSPGDYLIFDNAYTGATSYANAEVNTVTANYNLSDYINFLNNTLILETDSSYPKTSLYNHIEANTNLLSSSNDYYKLYGSIETLKINKSGLNYKFHPRATVINTDPQAQNLYLYELFIDTVDTNTYFLTKDTIVSIDGEPAYYAGSKYLTEEDIAFENLLLEDDSRLLSEPPYVETFYAPRTLATDIANSTLELFSTQSSEKQLEFLQKTYDANTTLKIDIINYAVYEEFGETAKLDPILGYGVSKVKLTNAGFLVDDDNEICFINGPKKRKDTPLALDTTLEYKHGILFDPIEEFIENNSNLSSEKHIQDNYYYQSFSYEITTKIPAEVIEPLLLDELHPAGFIAFIRNKIDEEVSMHLKAYEFPRIELLSENNHFDLVLKPYLVQMQEQQVSVRYDDLFNEDRLFVRIDVDNKEDGTIKDNFVEQELESNNLVDIFEGFRLFVEDCLIRPETKSLQEFRKCDDDSPRFDNVNYFFDINQESANVVYFDSDGSACIPTGYGTTQEYSRLEKEIFEDYNQYVAFDSFMKIIKVEDSSNWKTDPILRYKGTIGSRNDYVINNHKGVVEEIINLTLNRNVGGKIAVRDFIGLSSKYTFDTELVQFYYDPAFDTFDLTLNFSGEGFNFTPTPMFYFDSLDSNNLIHDFSSTNIINLICNTPHHTHFNLNFSSEPFISYKPVVSGNTLVNKGSYLPTTEILTKNRGYVQIKNLRLEDEVAFIKDDNRVTWRKPDEIVRQQYNGIMYQFTDYNRMSITMTPSQELVIYNKDPNVAKEVIPEKIKSDRLNLHRATNDYFGLVDDTLVGTSEEAVTDFIPIQDRIHRNVINYEGDVYCLIFNEYKQYMEMTPEINYVDLDVLQLYSKINNDHTLPKFEPIDIYRQNHTHLENDVKINIEKQDFTLYLPTSNSILFDFNTNKDSNNYVSFVAESGLTNDGKIFDYIGPSFDNTVEPQTFDADKRFSFDSDGRRFQVNLERMYYGMNHVLTKVPVGHEQRIQYTKESQFDYFSHIDGNLPKTCPDFTEEHQEILVTDVTKFSYNLLISPEESDVYLNGILLLDSVDYNIVGNILTILIKLNLNDIITVNMRTIGTCNTAQAEFYRYQELKFESQNVSFIPREILITENSFLLYPKGFGPTVTFDLAALDAFDCINGSLDYIGANTGVYKFDSNTGQLSFDYDRDQCVRKLADPPLHRYLTFDTSNRSFDQTNDFYIKTEQYIEPEQILANADDSDVVSNKQNATYLNVRNAEIVKTGEDLESVVVATIKNYRLDLKKKFFDSIIWTFDRDYNKNPLYPLEYSGFDNEEISKYLDLDCVHIFFDNDSFSLDKTTIGFKTTDNSPKTFAETFVEFSDESFKFDRFGVVYKDCSVPEILYPYDDTNKNITLGLIEDLKTDAYGPFNLSKSFDSSIDGHGFDKEGYPYFDNAQGGLKPFIITEPIIINVDTRDVSVLSGRNDPIQTLILSAEDAYTRKLTTVYEQTLINWNQIVICNKNEIYDVYYIKDYIDQIIRPFLTDDACDPSSTKGTYAEPDYLLINSPLELMTTEISERQDIIYTPASFVDATLSDSHTNQSVAQITFDILSCQPIYRESLVGEFIKYKIEPYITEKCPGDDRILRSKTDTELAKIINEADDTAYSYFHEYAEFEIYSHDAIDLYPDSSHFFASNTLSVTTVEHPYIMVAQHLGSRNCVISMGERIGPYTNIEIEECHLNQGFKEWIKDTIHTIDINQHYKYITINDLDLSANSFTQSVLVQPITIKNTNLYINTSNGYNREDVSSKNNIEIENLIPIKDRNIYIETDQPIQSKVDDIIFDFTYDLLLTDYAKDKIPTVAIPKMTEIVSPTHVHTETYLSGLGEFSLTKELNDLQLYSTLDYSLEVDTHKFIEDRNIYVNVKDGLFTNRLNELLTDYLLSRKLIDYEGDTIPSVKGLPQHEVETFMETDNIFYTLEDKRNKIQDLIVSEQILFSYDTDFIDVTISNLDNSIELINYQDLYSRNMAISINDVVTSNSLDKRITSNYLNKYIMTYTGDHIPTVSVDLRPSFNQFRIAHFNFSANTEHDSVISGEPFNLYIQSNIENQEFNEIENDKVLLSDIKFISPDDIIGTYVEYYLNGYEKVILRPDRFDTTRTIYPKERHEFEFDNFISNENIAYDQATILYQKDSNNMEFINSLDEQVELRLDNEICDLYSIIPLADKVKGTRWEYLPIEKRYLKNNLVEYGGSCIESVQVDSRPSFQHQRFQQHDLQSNTTYETTLTGENLNTYVQLDSVYDEQVELRLDNEICDLYSIIPLADKVKGTRWEYLPIEKRYLKNNLVEYGGGCIESVQVDSRPSFQHQRSQQHDLQSNTTYETTLTGENLNTYVQLDSVYDEYLELQVDNDICDMYSIVPLNQKVKETRWEYFTIDKSNLDNPIMEYGDGCLQTVYALEEPSIEVNHYIGKNPNPYFGNFYELLYNQYTVVYLPDTNKIDATIKDDQFFEKKRYTNVYDVYSVVPINEKVLDTRWEYTALNDKILKNILHEKGDGYLETVQATSEPSIEVNHYIGKNPNPYFGNLYELNYKLDSIVHLPETNFINFNIETEQASKIQHYEEICDLYSIVPLDKRVLGTLWEDIVISNKNLKNMIKEDGYSCIETVTVDNRPSIEYFRAYAHNLERSLQQHFTMSLEDFLYNDAFIFTEEFDEFEMNMLIGDRNLYIGMNRRITDTFLNKLIIDHENLIIIEDDRTLLPSASVEVEPNYSSYRTYKHDLSSNTTQYFTTLSDAALIIDMTQYYQEFNEMEIDNHILNVNKFYNLDYKIQSQMFDERLYDDYGLLREENVLTKYLMKKVLTDSFDDKLYNNIITLEPHFERLYVENAYFTPEHGNGNFIKAETNYIEMNPVNLDLSLYAGEVESYHERNLNISNENYSFSLANIIENSHMYEKLDENRSKRLIKDFSYYSFRVNETEPKLINRPIEYMPIESKMDTILTGRDFEKFIDAQIELNMLSQETVDKLIYAIFNDYTLEANNTLVEVTVINRPNEYANTAVKGNKTLMDTIIQGTHFEKFIDSTVKQQEIFAHIDFESFGDSEINANNTITENILINRPNEYANTSIKGNETILDTILCGDYFEKFIDSSTTTCSELYQYNDVKVMNVVLKDVSTIPWFSSNIANASFNLNTLNEGWLFSTNSANTSQTNTIAFFSTGGPDYQVELSPTYIDMAFATSSAKANTGYASANGWQYIGPDDALPIPTANLAFESNRTIRMAMFEKIEFTITDIANNHIGYYFAIGSSPWFDNNREANALFGIANGVTYELDGVVYTDFNKYKSDFVSGLKANAKITFAPTISLAMLKGSDPNTVNGANSDSCPTFDVYAANTYTFYYWSNANNQIYSAGGEIEIYELNNLEECVNYSINKTSYIDNIRSEKEFICA